MRKGDVSFRTVFSIVAGMCVLFGALAFPAQAATGEGNVTPTYTATPSGTIAPQSLVCKNLVVTSGQNATAPTDVRLTTHVSGTVRSYRYHFGDGQVKEGAATITHHYDTGGSYQAYVEVQDEKGSWVTSAACQTTVNLANALAAGERWGCGELQILSGQDASASAQVQFRLATIDNKTKITRYKLDFGDGASEENDTGLFAHRYTKAGTYAAKGRVQTQDGAWNSDETVCSAQVRVASGPMSTQPQTGVSIEVLIAMLSAGLVGTLLLTSKHLVQSRL
jgi:hypothetical protein